MRLLCPKKTIRAAFTLVFLLGGIVTVIFLINSQSFLDKESLKAEENAAHNHIHPEERRTMQTTEILETNWARTGISSSMPNLKGNAPISQRIAVASILCSRNPGQLEQFLVMLKSLLLLSWEVEQIQVHVIADSEDTYSDISETTASWPPNVRASLILKFHKVWYPADRWWLKSYRAPCTTEKLYLPVVLKDVDSVIYVDTDVIFLNSASKLWKKFSGMNESQFIGVTAEHEDPDNAYYNSHTNKVPFYGKLGVNAGVILFNLTRARSLAGGGWVEEMHSIYDKYQNAPLHFADQDILNIFLHFNPDKLLELSCDWNYRTDHCQSKKNTCKRAKQYGVSLIHGNRGVFQNSDDYTFKAVYDTFKKYIWVPDIQDKLINPLKRLLEINVNSLCGAEPEIFTFQLVNNLKSP